MNLHRVVIIGFLCLICSFRSLEHFGWLILHKYFQSCLFPWPHLILLGVFGRISLQSQQSRHTRHWSKFNVYQTFDYMGPPSTILNGFFFTFSVYFAFQLARQRNSTNNAPPIARHTHSLTRLAANNTKKWERSTRGSSLTAQIPWPTHTTLHLTACKRIAIVSTMLQHFRWIFALIYFTLVSVFNWWQNQNAALLAQPFLTWWIGWMDGRMEIKKKFWQSQMRLLLPDVMFDNL